MCTSIHVRFVFLINKQIAAENKSCQYMCTLLYLQHNLITSLLAQKKLNETFVPFASTLVRYV